MVKKYGFLSRIAFGAALVVSLTALPGSAALVSLSPSASDITLGGIVNVDIIVTLQDGEDLGAFDFQVNYDPDIFQFVSGEVPETMGGLVDASPVFLPNDGNVNVFWCSELGSEALANQQSSSFALAKLFFEGCRFGTSEFKIDAVNIFGDAIGDPLVFSIGNPASVHVPEPTTLALLLIGLTGLPFVGMRKRKS